MELSSRFISLALLLLVIFSNRCWSTEQKPKPKWNAEFYDYYLVLRMGEQIDMKLVLTNLNKTALLKSSAEIRVVSDSFVLRVDKEIPVSEIENDEWHGKFRMDALFLGAAYVHVEIDWKSEDRSVAVERSTHFVSVQIIRKKPPAWTYTEYYDIYETTLYIVLRFMLGLVLQWQGVTAILEKPLCVAISLCSSVIIMPMTGYVLGFIIFPEDIHMQFVLLVIGACLMKGISNFWTICLTGNVELSVAISILNALLTSGIIPLYLSTLGETKLPNSIQHVPYPTIGLYISYTIFPLLIGILIKCGIHCICTINPNKWFVTILRCLSLLYIVSITGYAIASVWDLLAPSALVVSWRFYLAGFLFPVCGFSIASLVAFICRQAVCDRFAIAAETINFNAFIALSISTSMLTVTSKELATLLAYLVVIMTPIPLFLQFLWYRIRKQKDNIDICKGRGQFV